MVEKKPKILVCPLNWGLGHATRIVPVVVDPPTKFTNPKEPPFVLNVKFTLPETYAGFPSTSCA